MFLPPRRLPLGAGQPRGLPGLSLHGLSGAPWKVRAHPAPSCQACWLRREPPLGTLSPLATAAAQTSSSAYTPCTLQPMLHSPGSAPPAACAAAGLSVLCVALARRAKRYPLGRTATATVALPSIALSADALTASFPELRARALRVPTLLCVWPWAGPPRCEGWAGGRWLRRPPARWPCMSSFFKTLVILDVVARPHVHALSTLYVHGVAPNMIMCRCLA